MEAILQFMILTFVACAGTGIIFIRNSLDQTIASGFYGGLLVLFFVIFQAPDDALSEVVINAGFITAVILLTYARIRRERK